MILRVCLTGGIASGKSTVANYFKELGTPIIDTDIIARQVVEPGTPCFKKITEHFGESVLTDDGELDRHQMRQIIFNDARQKQWLEQLLHPAIREAVKQKIDAVNHPYVIVVIPLYAESKGIDFIDRVCVVDIDPELQLKRLMQRDDCDEATAQKIVASQASREQRLGLADDIVENSGDREGLAKQVESLHGVYSTII